MNLKTLEKRVSQLANLSSQLSAEQKERALLNLNDEIVPSHSLLDYQQACTLITTMSHIFEPLQALDAISQEYCMLRLFDVKAHQASALASKLKLKDVV